MSHQPSPPCATPPARLRRAAEPALPDPPSPAAPRHTRRWVLGSLAALAAVALAATVPVILPLFRAPGAATPQAAVTELIAEMAQGDLAGAGRLIAASERDALLPIAMHAIDGSTPSTKDLLHALRSVRITLDGELSAQALGENVVRITLPQAVIDADAGALATLTGSAPPGRPGWSVRPGGAHQIAQDAGHPLAQMLEKGLPYQIGAGTAHVIVVQEAGRWFISPLMTAGEMLIEADGRQRGPLTQPGSAAGAASPEAAAQAFTRETMTALWGDDANMAPMLPLHEARFAAAYEQVLIAGLRQFTGFTWPASEQPVRVTFHSVDVARTGAPPGPRGGIPVMVTGFSADLDGPGMAPTVVRYAAICTASELAGPARAGSFLRLTVRTGGEGYLLCGNDPVAGAPPAGVPDLVAVKQGGGWVVSMQKTLTHLVEPDRHGERVHPGHAQPGPGPA